MYVLLCVRNVFVCWPRPTSEVWKEVAPKTESGFASCVFLGTDMTPKLRSFQQSKSVQKCSVESTFGCLGIPIVFRASLWDKGSGTTTMCLLRLIGIGLRGRLCSVLSRPEFYQPNQHISASCKKLNVPNWPVASKLLNVNAYTLVCCYKMQAFKTSQTLEKEWNNGFVSMHGSSQNVSSVWRTIIPYSAQRSPVLTPFYRPSMLLCSTDEFKATKDHRPVYRPSLCNGIWGFLSYHGKAGRYGCEKSGTTKGPN